VHLDFVTKVLSWALDTVHILFSSSVLLWIVAIWYLKYFIWCHFLFSVAHVLMENSSLFCLICYVRSQPIKVLTGADDFKHMIVLDSRTGECQIWALWWIRYVTVLIHLCGSVLSFRKAFGTVQYCCSTGCGAGYITKCLFLLFLRRLHKTQKDQESCWNTMCVYIP